MAEGLQASEESATRSGIQALGTASSGVTRCIGEVENTKNNLLRSYKGADGQEYKNLIESWELQAGIIHTNLTDMINALEETLQAHGLQQSRAKDEIHQRQSQSNAVFDTLQG
ncbi:MULTISPECIES: hypothetical protein [Streptomyces]|uniref:hypothetical protein n=1 Tax=Streptomyces TaxID=1883 RepID=UPI000CD5C7C4|nr:MULTISPECIES: hypothetical protein [Streptomyces]